MDRDMDAPAVRFSFGKHNTLEEVDYTIEVLKKIFK
jgi:cysteine sulfinate desulfinase/cysteine desulfurase-like protein